MCKCVYGAQSVFLMFLVFLPSVLNLITLFRHLHNALLISGVVVTRLIVQDGLSFSAATVESLRKDS